MANIKFIPILRDRKPRVAKEEKKEAPAAEATPVVEDAAPATENTENN